MFKVSVMSAICNGRSCSECPMKPIRTQLHINCVAIPLRYSVPVAMKFYKQHDRRFMEGITPDVELFLSGGVKYE